MKKAFTLIELMVVVTIIVILIAMLLPAMSKAIYRAKLVQCAAQMRATTTGVQSYAFDFKKFYPPRSIPTQDNPDKTIGLPLLLGANNQASVFHGIDIRTPLKGYISINKQLNDPFVSPIDLEDPTLGVDSTIHCSYALWFGWRYQRSQGMEKIGDHWEFGSPQSAAYGSPVGPRPYGLLMGDLDLVWSNKANISASHPDIGPSPKLWMHDAGNKFEPTYGAKAVQVFWVYFSGGIASRREDMDLNYAYDDGSVTQLNNLAFEDDRYDVVPYFYDSANWPGFRVHIPKR